jgi:hypothetical protein
MALYLSSDERTLDNSNTRTKFKNSILPDFLVNDSFNLKLHEIFFDSKFPTLANFEYPHIITTVIRNEHQLQDFPEKFQNNSMFKYLFKKHGNKEYSPLMIEKNTLSESQLSEIDFEVFYEIHPRLGFAFSIAFIKDISIHSQKDVVNFLNSFMFPFHKKKPLSYLEHGYVEIESNLNMFLSKNLLHLLGFNSFESEMSPTHLNLPTKEKYLDRNFVEDPYASVIYPDMLSRMEEESPVYSNYRKLIEQKPKGNIQIEFAIGSKLKNFEVEYELDLFHQRSKAINYDDEIDLINRLMLNKYLSVVKENILSMKLSSSEEDLKDLDDFITYLKDRTAIAGLEKWGGLFTVKRKNKQIFLDVFHTNQTKEYFKTFHDNINLQPGAILVKQASFDIFYSSKLRSVSFNPTLCHLLGVSDSTNSFITLQMEGEKEKIFTFPLNYYRSVRHELEKIGNVPFALQLIQIQDRPPHFPSPLKLIKTNHENIFMIGKNFKFFSDEQINLKLNSPQLIFVMADFVQHSLAGSNQQQILNFFPLPKDSNGMVYHRFKKPIILKTIPSSVFHINLVDENFNQIKADVGKPTLLALKKSFEANMIPVTLISSDKKNLKLYPENKSNSFTNKLSFPLFMNQRDRWGVSLRSLAYPKVMNVFSEYCYLTVTKIGQEESVTVSLDNSYVTSGTKFIYLLNEKIKDRLSLSSDSALPSFSLKDGFATIETNGFECHLNGDMLKILGLTHSYQDEGITYAPHSSAPGVLELNLYLLQPQEMMITCNVVEEAFYAQDRPKILKIVPIATNQTDFNAYNYIQFDDEDIIPVKLDRIDEVKITIMTRKGDLINFVDHHDVKCQLEFKQIV